MAERIMDKRKENDFMRKKSYIGMAAAVLLTGTLLSGCGSTEAASVTQGNVSASQTLGVQTEQTAPMQVPTTAPVQSPDSTQSAVETTPAASQPETTQPAAGQAAAETTQPLTDTGISPDAAKDIALQDAGVQEAEVSGIRVRREMEDGRDIYDVEFYVQNKEYDYEIAAFYGEILSSDFDIDDDFYYPGGTQAAPTGAQEGVISMEEAANLALAKVPGATSENIRIKLDWDDGRQFYEGDIYYNQKEYEFEMDAATGDFLEWSEESIYQ